MPLQPQLGRSQGRETPSLRGVALTPRPSEGSLARAASEATPSAAPVSISRRSVDASPSQDGANWRHRIRQQKHQDPASLAIEAGATCQMLWLRWLGGILVFSSGRPPDRAAARCVPSNSIAAVVVGLRAGCAGLVRRLLLVGPGQRPRIPLVGARQRPPTATRTSRISAITGVATGMEDAVPRIAAHPKVGGSLLASRPGSFFTSVEEFSMSTMKNDVTCERSSTFSPRSRSQGEQRPGRSSPHRR
jgi:hypothetical protein